MNIDTKNQSFQRALDTLYDETDKISPKIDKADTAWVLVRSTSLKL